MDSYEVFYQTLKDAMNQPEMALEYGDKLRFLDNGYHPAPWAKEDLILVKSINSRRYNSNSDILKGDFLVVSVQNDMQVRISVAELYEDYKRGGMAAVAEDIKGAFTVRIPGQEKLDDLHSYEKARPRLYVRLLNYANEQARLDHMIYRRIGDFAQVLYYMMSEDSVNTNWTKVPTASLAEWGMSADQALDQTLVDCSKKRPARLYLNFSDVSRKDPSLGQFMDPALDVRIGSRRTGMLTTFPSRNGAVAFFYPGVADRLAEIVGGSYYVSFTAVDEAMIHGKGFTNEQQVINALFKTNRQFNNKAHGTEVDKLTDLVYRYDAEKKILFPIGGAFEVEK